MTDDLLQAALAYAARGIPVFPCSDKVPLTEHGFKDATVDEAQIRKWWTEHSNAQIAIPCDDRTIIDTDEGGLETLLGWMKEAGVKVLEGHQTKSGGGWPHFHYQKDSRFKNRVAVGKGLDIRAEGGYIIVAPSLHSGGGRYEGRVPDANELLPMPSWLTERLLAAQTKPKVATGLDDGPIKEGSRNTTLFRIGSSLRGAGWGASEIEAHLKRVNDERCEPPISKQELSVIIGQVVKFERGISIEERKAEIRKELDGAKPEPEAALHTETLADIYVRYKDYNVPWVIRPIAASGEVTLIAAPPKKGKTTFILQALRKLAAKGIPVLYYSLEMAKPTLVARIRSLMSELQWTTDFFKSFYVVGPDELKEESLWKDIIVRVQETDAKIVVVDNLLATVVGNINKTDVSASIMNTAFAIATKLNVSIVLISHTRKNPPTNSIIEMMAEPSMDDATGNRMFTARASIIVVFSANSDGRRLVKSFSRLGEDISVEAIFDPRGFWRHSQRAKPVDMEWLNEIGIDNE